MIELLNQHMSIRRQCELVGLNRATFYYEPVGESALNLALMRLIDEEYTRHPFAGSPRMVDHLHRLGYQVNHKRVERLLRKMGLRAIYPGPRTSLPALDHKVYPYLLRGLPITRPLQVWAADITYVPMASGFMYLVAIMDWFSRFVVSWRLSNSLDSSFCVDALEEAIAQGKPEIFNTDQGSQFTSNAFTSVLEAQGVRISMNSKGRAFDNIFVERLWRTVKWEDIYVNNYETVPALRAGLGTFFEYYNYERPHDGLRRRRPAEVFCSQSRVA